MRTEIVGPISDIEVVARGRGIRDLARLQRVYGKGFWRKLKGRARVRFPSGDIRWVELHWYEAHGIGKKGLKVKRVEEEG